MGLDSNNGPLKIDLGCGSTHREGFIRVDNVAKANPDVCMDMQEYVKTLEDDSVSEAWVMHSIEFLDGYEIYDFMNELHRVIKTDGFLKVAVTSVTLPSGGLNPRAWTVPLLKTHFSPSTFKVFDGGTPFRDLAPWVILETNHGPSGGLVVLMSPQKAVE